MASNTALVAANEQLGKATQAKSDFLSSLTKELNTPIQGILRKTERLMQGTATEAEERRGIKSIRHTAESLERLVGDVRDFSRMEAHKVKLEAVNFDLADVFEELLGAMEGAAAAKGLYLAAMIPPKIPTRLKGDPERLRQVLANLVVNGLEFTAQGAVALRVTQLSETELQAILCFEVQDTGCGIPIEAQTRIFLPFSKGGEVSSHDGRGAGLGLAICRELVELMGGHIGLESTPGKGSIFRFTMAFLKQKNGTARPELGDDPEPRAHRVLVVDGRECVRRLIEDQMRYFGFHVCGAPDAGETLRMLRAPGGLPFDVVLLNVPEEDASPLVSKIRAEPSLASVRLVLLSPDGALDTAPWGIDAVLPTPLREPAVLQSIRELGKKSPGLK
ncbi:MAG: ATP-binding protein [Chthoniobacteraceae bacterium]